MESWPRVWNEPHASPSLGPSPQVLVMVPSLPELPGSLRPRTMVTAASLFSWAEPTASYTGEGKWMVCSVNEKINEWWIKGVCFNPVLTNSGSATSSLALTYPRCKESRVPSFRTHNRVYDTTDLASSYWEIPNLSSSLWPRTHQQVLGNPRDINTA